MSEAAIQLESVSKWYEGAEERRILDQVDFSLSAGDRACLIGPSGCGKSTFLNILGTLDQPNEGTVRIDGQDTGALSTDELAALRAQKIGFIFQSHHLLPQCSALENVSLPTLAVPAASRKGRSEVRDMAMTLFERVGLADKAARFPGELSGGEQQRVAVVRALINEPSIVLADEPTGALDDAAADQLIELLVELNVFRNLALVVVTHDLGVANIVGGLHSVGDGKVMEVQVENA